MLTRIQNEFTRIRKSYRGEVFPYKAWNHAQKAIFIHIPKCGGTSVLKALGAPVSGRCHAAWHEYSNTNNWYFTNYFKFSLLRHPLHRLESAYHYLAAGSNQSKLGKDLLEYTLAMGRCYEEFIETLDLHVAYQIPALRPQWTFICDETQNIMVDYLGRIEDSKHTQEVLSNKLNFQIPDLPTINQTEYQKYHGEYPESVMELYARDFALCEFAKNCTKSEGQ